MWHHARLLRVTLLLSSLLSLSGLHQQQARPSAGWRVVRLLPLTLLAANCGANLTYLFTTKSAWLVMEGLSAGMVMYLALLQLLHLLRHRSRLHALLRQLAALEEATAACRQPGDHSAIQWLSGSFVVIIVGSFITWITKFLHGEVGYPNYVVPAVVPEALRGPPWYWVGVSLQMMCLVIVGVILVTFDIMLFSLMGAVTLFQTRLGRFCQESLCGMTQLKNDRSQRISDFSETVQLTNAAMRPGKPTIRGMNTIGVAFNQAWNADGSMEAGDTVGPSSALKLTPAEEAEHRLSQLTETYGSVRRLAADAADLCSIPTFCLHGCITGAILVGSYVTIVRNRNGVDDSHLVNFAGYTLTSVLELLLISFAGGRLIQQGRRLHETLASAGCSAPLPSAGARLSLQMLLELTRRPICFDGCGMFVVQKANLLSLLSFVLTYFIIMLQMGVALN